MEWITLLVIALFLVLIVFSIVLNVRDMKWFVDFTEADAKEKVLSLGLDSAEIRRYRRRRSRFGRFGGAESLSDYVQIPLEAPHPQDLPINEDELKEENAKVNVAKAIVSLAKGTALLTDQHDLLVVFGVKDKKEHRIYSCDFTEERLSLAKETISIFD